MSSVKEVWQLNDIDYKEIEGLYERKVALENLSKIINPNEDIMYEKLIKDYGKTCREFDEWWKVKGQEYKWEGQHWWLDFNTKKIMTNE